MEVLPPSSTQDRRGAYDKQGNRIYVRSHMTNRHTLGALAHEYAHARLGHDGHQSPAIEKRVDEYAAQMLVDPHEYAALEPLYEGNAASIASELDLPVWVVVAWQRSYTRTRHIIEDDYRVRCGLAM